MRIRHMLQNASPFVGRTHELAELTLLRHKKTASLVVIRGRRRVGKSRLIEEFARGSKFYEFSGLSPEKRITEQQQRDHFAYQLSQLTGLPEIKADDWSKLFFMLAREVADQEAIILLDEISWMGSHDPTFLGKFKTAWDIHFKKNPKLILVLCGSVSAWIEENILKSKLFMGRVSLPIVLKELPIPACNRLLKKLGCQFSSYEKFKLLAVMGGIPRYLEEIQPGFSADENIRRLCFTPNGILAHEFEDIFTDIFSKRSKTYRKIIKILVDGSKEINTISKKLGLSRGGHLSECLEELCMADVITRHYTWSMTSGKESTLSQYRLSDNYLRFYLKYIESNLGKISEGHYRNIALSNLPGWSAIMGFQFENLVLNNREYILETLHIPRESIIADNPFFQRKTQRQSGCQIDYMVQTREQTLYVCEIKFSRYEIKLSIIDEMREKIKRLSSARNYAILPVLIHINGVAEAIEDNNYFYKIIDFSQLMDNSLK